MNKLVLFFVFILLTSTASASEEYFYCGFTNTDGSAQNYAQWGKGTDFKFNARKDRWEWITEYTRQYIYPSGAYEQKTKVPYFQNQFGVCNSQMKEIYDEKIQALIKQYQ